MIAGVLGALGCAYLFGCSFALDCYSEYLIEWCGDYEPYKYWTLTFPRFLISEACSSRSSLSVSAQLAISHSRMLIQSATLVPVSHAAMLTISRR